MTICLRAPSPLPRPPLLLQLTRSEKRQKINLILKMFQLIQFTIFYKILNISISERSHINVQFKLMKFLSILNVQYILVLLFENYQNRYNFSREEWNLFFIFAEDKWSATHPRTGECFEDQFVKNLIKTNWKKQNIFQFPSGCH